MKKYLASKNKKWLALIIVGLITVVIVSIKSYSENMNNFEKMVIPNATNTEIILYYQNGKDTVINNEASYFQALQREVEDFLISSNDSLWEAVLKKTILGIKEGKAVEIIYSEPKELKISHLVTSRNLIKIERILIPLEGYYLRAVFVWEEGNKFYSSGPYVNREGSDRVERIKEIIRNAKIFN